MTNINTCEFCKKIFSTKSNLKSHKNSAKYCLKIQNRSINDKFKCDGCGRKFTTLLHINRHTEVCTSINVTFELREKLRISEKQNLEQNLELQEYKSKYNTLIEEYTDSKREHKREIQILQDKLENVAIQIAKRPTTQSTTYNNRNNINTIIQNLNPITEDNFKEQSRNLTMEHVKQGVKGYVEYALEYPLKDKVLCVDYARRKIKYKDEDGKVQTDPEMNILSQKIFESIVDKNKELAVECMNRLSDNMDAEEKMQIIVDMGQLIVDINQSSRGQKTDFTHDFVRGVCSKTVR
jgi:hypothetical protein